MKKFLLAGAFALASSTAFADDAKAPAKPTCGATVEECQKKADADAQTIKELTAAYQGAKSQRDVALSSSADRELSAYVTAQTAKK